jgi:GNAT superfamily N-acetyltransferase
MAEFDLRPMEPSDGPAMDVLMRNEALTTAMSLSTHYRFDLYQALKAQYPTLFGVVASAPGEDGLAGMATVYTDEVTVNGRLQPSAHLANLKVRQDVRRRGLGTLLAEWRIREARRQIGDEGIIVTSVEASNAASLATARRWATQVLGPVRVVIARAVRSRPRGPRLEARPLADDDIDAVVTGINAFLGDYQLFPRQTPSTLRTYLDPAPIGVIRQYRVAVDGEARIVAGAAVTERFKMMEDHVERVPPPLALLSRVLPIVPPDRVLRTLELSLVWHAPGRVDAGRFLWDSIRFEWRDRATHFAGEADPRGTLMDVLRVGPTFVPRVNLMVPVQSQEPLDENRPVYLWR